jgi:hypothetical protein
MHIAPSGGPDRLQETIEANLKQYGSALPRNPVGECPFWIVAGFDPSSAFGRWRARSETGQGQQGVRESKNANGALEDGYCAA